MDKRSWEELNTDLLLKVFHRVGLDSLVLDVPFVCKSWYKVSLDPQCWKHLNFRILVGLSKNSFTKRFIDWYRINNFSDIKFIKFVVRRSCGSATSLKLPYSCDKEILDCLVDECPELKRLHARDFTIDLSDCIGKFKFLEEFFLNSSILPIEEVLNQISLHCKSFVAFYKEGYLVEKDALAIVTFLPKIKYLSLKRSTLRRNELLIILKGCRELEFLDVSNCTGFEMDDEMLMMASGIKTFKYQGCKRDEKELALWMMMKGI